MEYSRGIKRCLAGCAPARYVLDIVSARTACMQAGRKEERWARGDAGRQARRQARRQAGTRIGKHEEATRRNAATCEGVNRAKKVDATSVGVT